MTSISLSREALKSGHMEELLKEAERRGIFKRTTPEERRESKRRILAQYAPDEDVWVFGYGSLMWNPAFHFAESAPGLLYGYHRQFCLWTPLGRGSPENPGLILGLEAGGSCRGLAYRLDRDAVDEELDIVWNREMIGGAYTPRVVPIRTPAGAVRAVTFVINRRHERYAGRLPLERMAQSIATAHGHLGRCCDYLFNTVTHLDELGITDGPLHDLERLVRERVDD